MGLLRKIIQRLLQNKDKHLGNKLGYKKLGFNLENTPKPLTEAVIKLSRELKGDGEKGDINPQKDTLNPNILIEDNYHLFKDYILRNAEGNKLPRPLDIERDLKISEHERKKYVSRAKDEGLILKKNRTTNILNINYFRS